MDDVENLKIIYENLDSDSQMKIWTKDELLVDDESVGLKSIDELFFNSVDDALEYLLAKGASKPSSSVGSESLQYITKPKHLGDGKSIVTHFNLSNFSPSDLEWIFDAVNRNFFKLKN